MDKIKKKKESKENTNIKQTIELQNIKQNESNLVSYHDRLQEIESRYKANENTTYAGKYRMTAKPISFSARKRLNSTFAVDIADTSLFDAPISNINTIELKRSAVCPDKNASRVYSPASKLPRKNTSRGYINLK